MEDFILLLKIVLGCSATVLLIAMLTALCILIVRRARDTAYPEYSPEYYDDYDFDDDEADAIDVKVQAYRAQLSSLRSVSKAYVNARVLAYENQLWEELEEEDASPGFEDETEDQMVSRMIRWEVKYGNK